MALGQLRDLVEVDPLVLLAHAVADRLEPLARDVGRRAVGEMAAGRERHAQDGVARPQQREEHREVGGRPAVRLDVGEGAAEQPLGPVDRQLLGDVDEFAAAVVAPARIALGVLVGQHAALGLEHRGTGEVLRRDQLDLPLLAPALALDRSGDLRDPDRQAHGRRSSGPDRGRLRLGSMTSDPREARGRIAHGSVVDSLATRRAWRPPAKAVSRKVSRQSRATSSPIRRAPSASTLASLCSRASRAVVTS